MPSYIFSFIDGSGGENVVTMELSDNKAAHTEAARSVGQLMKDQPALVWDKGLVGIKVADERGVIIATLTVSAVVNG